MGDIKPRITVIWKVISDHNPIFMGGLKIHPQTSRLLDPEHDQLQSFKEYPTKKGWKKLIN